jgi:hypothetical protein
LECLGLGAALNERLGKASSAKLARQILLPLSVGVVLEKLLNRDAWARLLLPMNHRVRLKAKPTRAPGDQLFGF